MARLHACPFCRQLFSEGEVERCPECDVDVQPLDELPPSHDAELIEPEPPDPPELQLLAWTYFGRMRGTLLLLAAVGIGLFFTPWLHEYAPEIRILNGYEFARELGWLWGPAVAWAILFAVVLSRRTIYHMRGARLAVILLALMPLMTVVMRIVLTPEATGIVPRRYEWGWGLYATGLLAIATIIASIRFGGSLEDMPTQQPREGDETLH